MAGFQVANFSFGKNIKDDERQRAIAAMNNATTRRGQDIQAAQADANRAENARQFDERQAAVAAAQEENARQFDETLAEKGAQREENARQFDETQALKEQEYKDKRDDITRAQSWDDAIKMQQMEADDLKYQKWSAELNDFIERGNRDREEYEKRMQAQRELHESALGMVSEGVLLSGDIGGFTPSQVDLFNEKFGQHYDNIGKRDRFTGEPYEDGLIHLVQYQRDKDGNIAFGYADANGNIVEDPERKNPQTRPLVITDVSVPREDYEFGLSRLRQYGDRARSSRSSMSPERMEIESKKIGIREKELAERQRRASERQEAMRAKLAASISKNFDATSMGAGMDVEGNKKLQIGLQNVLMDFFNTASGGEEANPQESPDKNDGIPEFNPKGSYNIGDRFRRNGKMYEVGEDKQPHLVAEGE